MPKKNENSSTNTRGIRCSFCGKSQENAKRIVAGPNVYICDECIDLCKNIVENEFNEDEQYTLEEMEKTGGPEAYINIKYMIPTYQSTLSG